MQKTFWSVDDHVKASVITDKDNTTKFEILLTFDPSPEMLICILSVSGFTWYLNWHYFVMGYHEHIWFHQCQEDINSLYHFERIPWNIPGAYVSLESEIIQYIKYHVKPETDKIQINISGDGSKVSRISNFVVLSLLDDGLKSTLTDCPSVLSNFKYWGTRP
jgi:hypothetical protein